MCQARKRSRCSRRCRLRGGRPGFRGRRRQQQITLGGLRLRLPPLRPGPSAPLSTDARSSAPADLLPTGAEDRAAAPLIAAAGSIDRARGVWAFAHGMTILELNGRFPADADVDKAWHDGIRALGRPARPTGPDSKPDPALPQRTRHARRTVRLRHRCRSVGALGDVVAGDVLRRVVRSRVSAGKVVSRAVSAASAVDGLADDVGVAGVTSVSSIMCSATHRRFWSAISGHSHGASDRSCPRSGSTRRSAPGSPRPRSPPCPRR